MRTECGNEHNGNRERQGAAGVAGATARAGRAPAGQGRASGNGPYALLDRISSPADVKALDPSDLPELCHEIRHAVLASSAAIGGHVGPNLAVVELTVALHRVFLSPHDKLVWDVSHQTYPHKMLTGRARCFTDPAHYDDLSGFSAPAESPHDLFAMGHTSTSVSMACGLAKARDLAGGDERVVAVIGDGALSGGMAFEGLDNLAEQGSRGVIVVVNDNGWSIAEDHGGLYRGLARLRASGGTAPDNLFRALGLDYRFVADGNDEAAVEAALRELADCPQPTVLHICTVKGAGYAPAEAAPERWHHVGPFAFDEALLADGHGRDRDSAGAGTDPRTSAAPGALAAAEAAPAPAVPAAPTYADITGKLLLDRMRRDPRTIGISAATPYVMGFTPERRAAAGAQFVDTGIAEQHAVAFAAVLAVGGALPVLGIYSVFLQRAYDQLWHDVCLNRAPATFVVYGASVFGTRDATHLGFFDISLVRGLPDFLYLAPVCREEFEAMLSWAIDFDEGPVAIRVPWRGVIERPNLAPEDATDFAEVRSQIVRKGSDVAILALGDFFPLGEEVADELERRGIAHPTLINPRYANRVDTELMARLASAHRLVITLEDGVTDGGWGELVASYLGPTDVRTLTYAIDASDGFPDRYDPQQLLADNGMAVGDIVDAVEAAL